MYDDYNDITMLHMYATCNNDCLMRYDIVYREYNIHVWNGKQWNCVFSDSHFNGYRRPLATTLSTCGS